MEQITELITHLAGPLKSITFAQNSAYDYLIALGILIISLLVLKIFQVVVLVRLKSLAKKTSTDFDDVLIKVFTNIKPPFYFFISLYFAIQPLIITDVAGKVIKVLFFIVIVYEIIRALEKFLDYFITKSISKDRGDGGEKKQNESMIRILQVFVKIALWLVGLIIILSNLGIDVTSLVASLGIGGIAVALALQNVLADMFSSFAIYIDKPFQVGDYITIGTDMGTVKKIGLKSTRIETLQGEELVISNQEMTSARIQNFKKLDRRRIVFSLGVVYGTPASKLEAIPDHIKGIIDEVKNVDFDRCHFKSYGDFSLNFEIVYYVNSSEYADYMDWNEKVNLAIYKKFEQEKIEFAFPTQTVFVEK